MDSRLRTLRKAKGLTQVQLAEKAGICRSIIARHETGTTTMTTRNLKRVARVLGTDLDALAGGDTDGQTA